MSTRVCDTCLKPTEHEDHDGWARCGECGASGYWKSMNKMKTAWLDFLHSEVHGHWRLENDSGMEGHREELLLWRLRAERDYLDDLHEKVVQENERFLEAFKEIYETIKRVL